MFLCFLTFSTVFLKTELFTKLKNIFRNQFFAFLLSSLFVSINGFNQAFWLNLMTLCTFSSTNPWLNACFKFVICITHSSLSWKFATNFSTSPIFIPSGQNCKFCEGYVNFLGIGHQLQQNILRHFLHHFLCSEKSSTHFN